MIAELTTKEFVKSRVCTAGAVDNVLKKKKSEKCGSSI